MNSVDLAILGGGCAGLSLAYALIEQGYRGSVVIIEPRTAYINDRTWAFWQLEDHKWRSLIAASWSRWSLSHADAVQVQAGQKHRYQIISASDFYDHITALIAAEPNMTLAVGESAMSITPNQDAVVVETAQTTYVADHVIDTRPRCEADDQSTLWQVFYGGEIEVDHDVFHLDTAGLMENFRSSAHGVGFVYTLPTTVRTALVQLTWFHEEKQNPHTLEDDFWQEMRAQYGDQVRMVREEAGILPMGQMPQHGLVTDPRIIRAGQAHGALRASSGYGFWRIQRWAEQMAAAFVAGKPASIQPNGASFLSMMDEIFLGALRAHFGQAPTWFLRLSRSLTGDEFAKFMMGHVSVPLWIKVVGCLPKAPFLASLASMVLGRLTPHRRLR